MLEPKVAQYIIENMASSACYVQADGTVSYWNASAEKLTGFTAEEMVGLPFPTKRFKLMDVYDKNVFAIPEIYEQIITGRQRLCSLFKRKDNSKVAVRILVVPVGENAGDGWMVFMDCFVDINLLSDDVTDLRFMASHDVLTTLPNRRIIKIRFDDALFKAKIEKETTAFLFADIDHFRCFNNTYGHAAGDKLLQSLASVMEKNIRITDCLGRWGGDEFVALASVSSAQDAMAIAERFRKLVEEMNVEYEGNNFSITVSIGVTLLEEDDDLTSVIRRADKAMYYSKKKGRNRVTLL